MDHSSLIICKSAAATEKFGTRLGHRLKGGEVIELTGDLGSGKTTLVRGIARGAGSLDVVGSPTFTLSKVYKSHKCDIYHFDFYRLDEPGLAGHEIKEALENPRAVVVVEWGKVVGDVLPKDRLSLKFSFETEETRKLECYFPEKLKYLEDLA